MIQGIVHIEFFNMKDAHSAITSYNDAELNGMKMRVEMLNKKKNDIGKKFKRVPHITYEKLSE